MAVLVCGAGPVGLLLAAELARHGVAVRVIDKLPAPTTESRAIIVHARSLETLDRVGIAGDFDAAGLRCTGMEMRADTKATRARLAGHCGQSFSLQHPGRTDRDRAHPDRKPGQVGGRGRARSHPRRPFPGPRCGTGHPAPPDDRAETVETPWLIGTDGGHGDVRRLAGTALSGSFNGERFLMGEIASSDDREPTREWLQSLADERTGGHVRITGSLWLTTFDIHHAIVPRYRLGRVFPAGDSAHIHSPAGGQGMNTGMQDAYNLAWKLALAVRGRGTEELLESYHAERHPVAPATRDQRSAQVARTTWAEL